MALFIRRNGQSYKIRLPYRIPSPDSPIVPLPLPEKVILPFYNTNASYSILVKRGDKILGGQKIVDSDDFSITPIHTTISGEVSGIIKLIEPASGRPVDAIAITSDGEDKWIEETPKNPEALSVKEIVTAIREAGITEGVDTLPAHLKLTKPEGKGIEAIILNGCQCEPYLTSNARLLLENGEQVFSGLKIINRALPNAIIYIVIDNDRYDVIDNVEKMVKASGFENIKIVLLEKKYPAVAETSLVKTVLGIDIPANGMAADIGVAVFDIATAKAIHDAVNFGKPFIEKVITIAGSVNQPMNLLVRIGTPLRNLIDYCGGIKGEADEAIMNGLMMGVPLYELDFPVTKGLGSIVIGKSNPLKEQDCIRCGKCLDVCPACLVPSLLTTYAKAGRYDDCKENYIDSCFECGACAYICPSNIPLVQYIRIAKVELDKRAAVKQ
ncbi:MAG: electron transport complex subunit RsxC [Chloroflexota bacterium]